MNRPLIKYKSWLDVVEWYYTINQEVDTVYTQWVRLVDFELYLRLKDDKKPIGRYTLKLLLNATIPKSAPYAIRAGRFGYEFTLKSHDFVYLLPLTVMRLLNQVGEDNMGLANLELAEKATRILGLVDTDVKVKEVLYSY